MQPLHPTLRPPPHPLTFLLAVAMLFCSIPTCQSSTSPSLPPSPINSCPVMSGNISPSHCAIQSSSKRSCQQVGCFWIVATKTCSPCTRLDLWTNEPVGYMDVMLPNDMSRFGLYPALLVFSGGGFNVQDQTMGGSVARYLANTDVVVFSVSYHLGMGIYPAPFLDAQRAVTTVKARATQWHIDATRVGVLGASAGGMLASFVATHSGLLKNVPDLHTRSVPDFHILISAITRFKPNDPNAEVGDTQTAKYLFAGKTPSARSNIMSFLSNTNYITAACPPALVFCCDSDPTVSTDNSFEYVASLKAHGVPYLQVTDPCDVHGMNAFETWIPIVSNWLASNGYAMLRIPITASPLLATQSPSSHPIPAPTPKRTRYPTFHPSHIPTTQGPTIEPTLQPSAHPSTLKPTLQPQWPTLRPSHSPITPRPTIQPTTMRPTNLPTLLPTRIPTTLHPTMIPTRPRQTINPTSRPTEAPVTPRPTKITLHPTSNPSHHPTIFPTMSKPVSHHPSLSPSKLFSPPLSSSSMPSSMPSHAPSARPSISSQTFITQSPITMVANNTATTISPTSLHDGIHRISESPSLPSSSEPVIPTTRQTDWSHIIVLGISLPTFLAIATPVALVFFAFIIGFLVRRKNMAHAAIVGLDKKNSAISTSLLPLTSSDSFNVNGGTVGGGRRKSSQLILPASPTKPQLVITGGENGVVERRKSLV